MGAVESGLPKEVAALPRLQVVTSLHLKCWNLSNSHTSMTPDASWVGNGNDL